MEKTAATNTKYSRNETILKIGHHAKAIDFAKWWVLVKNSNRQKRAKNDSTITLELFFAKNRWKKTKYSRNETILKIGHLLKAIDFAKWSVWVKNSKGQKRAKNVSANTLQLFCAKNRSKKHHIFEKWDHFENGPPCKDSTLSKIISFGQKFKWRETCEKRFYKHVRVVLCKKQLKKTPNIREMRPFWKSAILQRL